MLCFPRLIITKLFPHIKYVMDKFKSKLPKDDLKRFAKEVRLHLPQVSSMPTDVLFLQISKKLVNSDFKNHRVEDPTRISSRQEKQVKKYVKEFFDKAVAKRREHDKKKAERQVKEGGLAESPTAVPDSVVKEESDDDQGMDLSDDEGKEKQASTTPVTPMDQIANGDGLKRKREYEEGHNGVKPEDADATP
ncbi:MAG: hypothetical protein LQ347_005063, partial [Umbilicaria vellea]